MRNRFHHVRAATEAKEERAVTEKEWIRNQRIWILGEIFFGLANKATGAQRALFYEHMAADIDKRLAAAYREAQQDAARPSTPNRVLS